MTGWRRAPVVLLPVLLLVGLGLAACSSGDGDRATPASKRAEAAAPVTYVSLGSTETNGGRTRIPIGDAWPHRYFRDHLPVRTTFVNLARDRDTVADAVREQLPSAIALRPTVVTIWFGTSDTFAATPLDRFQANVATLVDGVQQAGAQAAVILGPPPADGDVDTAPYTAAAAAIARARGAVVVDLRTTPVTAATQQQIADAVAKAVGPVR